jgi:hypothetical protein
LLTGYASLTFLTTTLLGAGAYDFGLILTTYTLPGAFAAGFLTDFTTFIYFC